MHFRFTIRDLLWLTLVVAMVARIFQCHPRFAERPVRPCIDTAYP
jgi:hypothetical protein